MPHTRASGIGRADLFSDDLGRWSWMAFEGKDNKEILIMSIYQCCKNQINPLRKTTYHQQETWLSERNRNDCDPRRNFFKDICKFLHRFKEKTDKQVLPILIYDWNEECIGKSNSKKLCDEFGLVNIYHRKFPNHEKFKTY